VAFRDNSVSVPTTNSSRGTFGTVHGGLYRVTYLLVGTYIARTGLGIVALVELLLSLAAEGSARTAVYATGAAGELGCTAPYSRCLWYVSKHYPLVRRKLPQLAGVSGPMMRLM
jgi:hypothetical protein